jgi:hypothetical protein
MISNQEHPNEIPVMRNPQAGPESEAPARGTWQRPSMTVIDIRRTMLIVGSVTDGLSGSL